MPKKPEKEDTKPLKSKMIRVPVALISAVRELSRLHRDGHTGAILQGLQSLISEIDSLDDAYGINPSQQQSQQENPDVKQLEQQVSTLSERIQKLETAYNQLATYINTQGSKRQSYYRPGSTAKPKQLIHTEVELASRLNVDIETLKKVRSNSKSIGEFISWSKSKDPSGLGWEYNDKDQRYYVTQ
ncbi:Hpt domain-containing protein (plasmid) [Nostoc sp. UHCC 0302]|uniref:Hpt domain-containing protein n=1 Tax=Nostoc sp. UHCC 0302 TaxID=3134896 RepID=UPI00311CB36A